MARPLRIEFAGATYHVTSRGDRREPIFIDDTDRAGLLQVVGHAMARCEVRALAWCLMGNHYHFVLQTAQANLSTLMRQINGVYAQWFNARHDKVGHLFQGRFSSVLVDRQAYLLEVCRYVELNPVRASWVDSPGDWRWSSYAANTARARPLPWMNTTELWAQLLGRPVSDTDDLRQCALRYAEWVAAGHGVQLWAEALHQQIYLGDEAFVDRMLALAKPERVTDSAVPSVQRASPLSLSDWLSRCATRDEAIVHAHRDSYLAMTAIAQALGLSVSRVSRIIAAAEAGEDGVRSCLLPPPESEAVAPRGGQAKGKT